MNYPPKHHQEQNYPNAIRVMKAYPFGTLISAKDSEIFATHIPLIYEDDGSTYGKLVAHIDKYNPQVELLKDGIGCTAIFYGPDTYISPSVYSTTQLPTWNYINVHIKGKVTRIEDRNDVRDTIIRMTAFLEGDDPKYVLTPDNPRMEAALDYIIGFEIAITAWEGKFKFSQDKLKRDQQLAKMALIKNNQQSIKDFVDEIMKHHLVKK
ncbi:FMN-binding negative transcriptional regulator [Sungkyunkwania multivorans]|uniref:FMN-binding negative transcriptional regulator n=1 Tax=Sungkyunkwania multivorans TaxID=1173618 RepID=A0ABW3CVV0_9FLAO